MAGVCDTSLWDMVVDWQEADDVLLIWSKFVICQPGPWIVHRADLLLDIQLAIWFVNWTSQEVDIICFWIEILFGQSLIKHAAFAICSFGISKEFQNLLHAFIDVIDVVLLVGAPTHVQVICRNLLLWWTIGCWDGLLGAVVLTIWLGYLWKFADTTFCRLTDSWRWVWWLEHLVLLLDCCFLGGYSVVLFVVLGRFVWHHSVWSRLSIGVNVFLVEYGDCWLHHMICWEHVRDVHVVNAVGALQLFAVAMLLGSYLESILLTKRPTCLKSWWFGVNIGHSIILTVNWAQKLVCISQVLLQFLFTASFSNWSTIIQRIIFSAWSILHLFLTQRSDIGLNTWALQVRRS